MRERIITIFFVLVLLFMVSCTNTGNKSSANPSMQDYSSQAGNAGNSSYTLMTSYNTALGKILVDSKMLYND